MTNLDRKNKYGEIILETENTFRIFCDLCTDTFLTMENFRYHIFKHLNSDSVEDSTDSFLDFIFKDDSDSDENLTKLEIEINPIEKIKEENKNILYNEESLNIINVNEEFNANESIENIVISKTDENINENSESPKSDTVYYDYGNFDNILTERKHDKMSTKTNYNTDDSDTDDSIKNFDNLEQKREYDHNVIRRKLKNIFKIYKDYCPICLHTFTSVNNLINHTKIHLRIQTKEEIMQIFKHSVNNRKNARTFANKYSKAIIASSSHTVEQSKILKCSYCEKLFVHNNDLQRHIRFTHLREHIKKLKCKICNLVLNSAYKFSSHMLDIHNIDEPFECNLCPEKFKKFSILSRHIRFHNNDKRYECEYCGKRFMENSQRKLHIRQHHTHEKLYQCDECGRGFTSLSEFKMHKLRHSNKREYKCTKCDKKFLDPYTLKNHFVTHSKEKPFECDVCHAKFGMRGALWTHSRLHSNERRYKCKICEKAFVQSAGLHSHMKTHCSKEK